MYVDKSHGFQPILSQDSAPNVIMALGILPLYVNRLIERHFEQVILVQV